MKVKYLSLGAVLMAIMVVNACTDPAGPVNSVNPSSEEPNLPPEEEPGVPMKLWYTRAAADNEWMLSALPIGNGTLGGMFFGGVGRERIQFNEKTLWKGSPTIRGAYQDFGSVYITFPNPVSPPSDYRRELSLDNAIGSVSYKADGVSYLREYFASFPDKVIAMRISTPDEKGKLNMTVALNGSHQEVSTVLGSSITFVGRFELLSYGAWLEVLHEGGSMEPASGSINIRDADTVTILLTGGTNYSNSSPTYVGESEEELGQRIRQTIAAASSKSWNELKRNHLNDYRPLFRRVSLDLNDEMPSLSTDQIIRTLRESSRYLDVLYFQYGRYLMIASSRGMNLPNNLQGIWNHLNDPPWQCDIHTNINIQMNYWPAEVTNLSECHMPFLNYMHIEALRPNGNFQQDAAAEGHPGWTTGTETNIFTHNTHWETNRIANAWYCMHLWQHYAYTDDQGFLLNTAFPVMKSACEYWLHRLIKASDGTWEAPNEWSPELTGLRQNGVSHAQQLIWDLFDKTLKASAILGINDSFTSSLQEKFNGLDNGVAVGSWGQIREFKYSNSLDTSSQKHRHMSHLVALYPGDQISPHLNTQFSEAAKVTLNGRGNGGTGWSRAWKIALWARLFDGNRAHTLLKAAMNPTTDTTINMDDSAGGMYENMLCAHPPFQIDGNFGATAGIAEMLLQSNQGFIHLLPALPSAWPTGSVRGLRAAGNFTVDITWANSQLVSCTIYSGSGKECTVYYKGEEKTFSTVAGGTYTPSF